MKTLYVRIVVTFIGIALVSGIIGLLLTNIYYQEVLHTKSQQKISKAAETVRTMLEQMPRGKQMDTYLTQVASLGYQLYYVDSGLHGTAYGTPFRHGNLSQADIQSVVDGTLYKGIHQENRRIMLFAYFENSLRNTIGMPVHTASGPAALFVRPDLEQQAGELRLIIAVLLVGTFAVSLLLIVVLSRLIVKPVKALSHATKQIVDGQFNVQLDVLRKDEIGDLALHFTEMSSSLQQVEQMRQQFVANVSHELQSPLTSIQGLAQASLENDGLQEETTLHLQIIEQESRRLSALSKQLLTLASLDQREQSLAGAPFRLDEQIRRIIIMLEWQWSEKQMQLELDLPETIITGEAELLYEVWLNLIVNAIKFSQHAGKLSISIHMANQAVVVEVSDTGEGIHEDELPRLFERFYKADKARNRNVAGSGLGLAIAHTIITLHGGEIAARSKLKQGSTFTVTLPQL